MYEYIYVCANTLCLSYYILTTLRYNVASCKDSATDMYPCTSVSTYYYYYLHTAIVFTFYASMYECMYSFRHKLYVNSSVHVFLL